MACPLGYGFQNNDARVTLYRACLLKTCLPLFPRISTQPTRTGNQLVRCVEARNKYLPLVNWRRLEDHTVGFRQSPEYQGWKRLLHHFYDPFPTVEHFEDVTREL
jgi:heme-degrading monooxygenase HmoA